MLMRLVLISNNFVELLVGMTQLPILELLVDVGSEAFTNKL
jgi:hypothetical protein